MSNRLDRLLRPRTIVAIGGRWAINAIEQCLKMDFEGELWLVNPNRKTMRGVSCFRSVDQLPQSPDAAFIAVNRHAAIDVVARLSAMGAGGAVCFASGFSESRAEDENAPELQTKLLQAADSMPLLGPNCYGLINYLDSALLWPDQHGGEPVQRGVALIAQSSNIAINLTMQTRGLPIAYVLTVGNQSQLSIGELGTALLRDHRVTALGLYIEGFGDIGQFENMAAFARKEAKPVVVIKAGRSDQARQALVSHTNSLSGRDPAVQAFLNRMGIARVHSPSALLETLKLLHLHKGLENRAIQAMSCSGGEAVLLADAVKDSPLYFPALNDRQTRNLRQALGPMVALANPLDYHTYIWNDLPAMTATFTAMMHGDAALTLLVIDFPRAGRCEHDSWLTALDALIQAQRATGVKVGILATLPENCPEWVVKRLMQEGIVSLAGVEDARSAIEAAAFIGSGCKSACPGPTLKLSAVQGEITMTDEARAKSLLSSYGLDVPDSATANSVEDIIPALKRIGKPRVLKGLGIAHKTELKAVHLGIERESDFLVRAKEMEKHVKGFLIEEHVGDNLAELLVSILRDSVHGFMLTLAAGGVLTELMNDSTRLLLPFTRKDVEDALNQLQITTLLSGYRGKAKADTQAIIDAAMSLQAFALDHRDTLVEVEINPLICGQQRAVVADALIRMSGDSG